MDNKPSLSQYFGKSEVPPASQFFDEIGTSPSDMIQSVYLGDDEESKTTTASLFPQNMTASFTTHRVDQDVTFSNVVPTVSASTAVPAASLPDPSTFFDIIGPEPQLGPPKSSIVTPNILTEAMEGLSVKNQPVDKEADRRRDAWIPNEEAKKTLMKAQSSPKGSFFPEREVLTMPGVVLEEELADALHEVAVKYLGVSAAGRAGVARAEHVPRDEAGLRELLRTGALRAAANLAHALLALHHQEGVHVVARRCALGGTDALHEVAVEYLGVSAAGRAGVARAEHVPRDEAGLRELLRTGALRAAANLAHALLALHHQGVGRMHRPSKHTPRTLQLWLTRFAILQRIKLYEPLLKEAEPFGDFSKPDMFYEFYPDLYENRTGSLVPFSLRLLVAELPRHVGRPEDAVCRLYAMLDVIRTMLSNLREGKTEDGSATITEQDKTESIRLWTGRETRVLHSIVNCAIAMKDYRLAADILTSLEARATTPEQSKAIWSALCRTWLLAGTVKEATICSEKAREAGAKLACPTPDVRDFVDLGLIDIAHGKYQDAHNNFLRAADQEPTNIMVANNLAVCLLYMGRLKEAIAVLQKAINSDPERGLNENLLINLCTLYELESSKTHEKKMNLLRMLCKYKSDTIPNVAECLKLS